MIHTMINNQAMRKPSGHTALRPQKKFYANGHRSLRTYQANFDRALRPKYIQSHHWSNSIRSLRIFRLDEHLFLHNVAVERRCLTSLLNVAVCKLKVLECICSAATKTLVIHRCICVTANRHPLELPPELEPDTKRLKKSFTT